MSSAWRTWASALHVPASFREGGRVILRRAANLSPSDNVRLEDGRLWNIESVVHANGRVTVHLSRTAGDKLVLELLPYDLILLAV